MVVTRARVQGSELVDRLEGLGATVVELPVIAIEGPDDGGTALSAAADRLVAGSYRWVAVTSSNAVSRLLDALGDRAVPGGVRWAAIGTATARGLADGGFPPDLVPESAVSDALAEAFPEAGRGTDGPGTDGPGTDGPDGPDTVLFPRAAVVRGALAEGLRAKGWAVDEVVAYRTVAGAPAADEVAAAGRADAIAFTSSSTVERTVEVLGPGGVPPVVVSIGPVTSATAAAAGLRVSAEASPHNISGLIDAVVAALARAVDAGGGGRSLLQKPGLGRDQAPRQQVEGQQQQ